MCTHIKKKKHAYICTGPGAGSLLGEVAIIVLNAYEHVELI
jgi:hypothetical protein